MIGATDAIDIAQKQLPRVVPSFTDLKPHVEEIRRSQDGQEWIITFRAENPNNSIDSGIYIRYFEKEVRLEASTGELLSVMNPSYN